MRVGLPLSRASRAQHSWPAVLRVPKRLSLWKTLVLGPEGSGVRGFKHGSCSPHEQGNRLWNVPADIPRVVIRIVLGDIRITGIRPDNGGSVQNWHWSWHARNWVP